MRIRKSYAHRIEGRNMCGLALVDRGDELAILHEKFAIQEDILRKGQTSIQERTDRIHCLDLEIAELRRRIEVRKGPSMSQVLVDQA